jgi:outer membrane lipoprotein-sorting protein
MKSFALSGKEIIEKSDAAIRGNTTHTTYEITIKARRFTRTMTIEAVDDRNGKRSFAEILSPPKDKGNRFLLIDQNMWQYVPTIQKTTKISPSMMLDNWMGSDFTNDDIVKESSIVKDYVHTLVGNEAVGSEKCHKVELKPLPDAAVVWGKILYFAREGDFLPVREEFYNEHGVLKKVLDYSDFRPMGGRVIPTQYLMKTVKKDDQFTLLKIVAVQFDLPVDETCFSMQHLKRR